MPRARRPLLLLVGATLLATLAAGIAMRLWPDGPKRPAISRVILLTIDTLRADALPFHGNPRVAAPALSALAREGILFEQAWSTSPWTRPSVVSFLTGLPPDVHGATFESLEVESVLPAAVPTLAECLGAAGYRTAAIGFNAFIANSPNVRRGFDDYWFYPRAEDGEASAPAPEEALVAGATDAEVNRSIDRINSTEVLTRLARHWITDHRQDDFFLWLHYYDPHLPYTPSRRFLDRIPDHGRPADRDHREWVDELNRGLAHFLMLSRQQLASGGSDTHAEAIARIAPLVRSHTSAIRALYEAEVAQVDDAVGQVVALLKELDLYDGTLIVVTSDHGEEFFEHGGLEHGHSLYQEQVHVPLVIKPPGASAPAVVRDRVSNQSVFPTLLDLCGVAPPPLRDEAPSLVPLWKPAPRSAPQPPYLVASSILYGDPQTTLVFGDRKYIHHDRSGVEELYDLAADPTESRPLGPEEAESFRRARAYLENWNRRRTALRKAIWTQGLRTTEENEATRKLLRSMGYLK